ncbi:alpha-amylase family glycosyl hydrolase [Jannaschia rubra]|uniref:Trehalose-6-phosphate hydrolase n=1 Tax=Jannaschia rubra TaxID=282197 RepID=A0A0M6XMQ5_9RHOB|nr:alpha-amylase family glycosyl hydrolase [Jannaschia rubra]CTQ31463.1 Trehalose-6-phosphate hydrolase [Jannaschia rubra]SFF78956.1 alpha-glucosidase [Jannaschia rubra]
MSKSPWPAAPVIYQIYPRSFRDTTGNGIGDLNGIFEKLGYVADLGVDAIWLSPFFPSPMADGGYDVADHLDVHPLFGTFADFDRVVERAHDLNLRIIIDQVFNHTSTTAPWFRRSVARDPDYDDYYVWADPKPDGTPPNNWLSQFGPPAWTWNHQRRQYYFHNFTAAQPSLNLRCERVQWELCTIMRFWRDRGVDGFRIDAVTSFLFDTSMADNPAASETVQGRVSGADFVPYTYQDHVHDILPGDGLAYAENLREWAGDEMFLIGEITSGNESVELACGLTQPGRMDAAYTTDFPENDASAAAYADILTRASDPGRLGWWLSSHDQPRHAAKAGNGTVHDVKFLALVLATAPGPVILYQGEELGLIQPRLSKSAVTDPYDLLYWPDGPGREGARVPIPWAERPGRAFTTGQPWLPMDWPVDISVSVQHIAADSPLRFYRAAFAFRRERLGRLELQDWSRDGDIIKLEYMDAQVILNFGHTPVPIDGQPDFASGPTNDVLPGRTAAVWLR